MNSFTPEQQQAITATGNVLVVAGAGTGKTRTLVERCLRLLLAEDGSLNEMLLVTFTEAAAAEMRHRIRDALVTRLRAQPGETRLAEQLALLDTAHISTLHSFCLHLVREHFDELQLDPEVAVLDEAQTQPLIRQTLDALLERCLEEDSEWARGAQTLIRVYGRGTDEPVRRLILQVHAYMQSLPDPDTWFERELARFREAQPRQWRQWLVEGFAAWSQHWQPVLAAQPTENVNARDCAEALAHAGISLSPDGAVAPEAVPELLPRVAKALQTVVERGHDPFWSHGTKGKYRDPIKKLFEEAAFLHSLVEGPADHDPLAEDWEWVRHPMITLLELTREFTRDFAAAKREWGGVDFADLEQFALRLLRQPGTGVPTPVAHTWRQRLRHVFVDEYQDINPAQDAILTLLSREGDTANRFLVGDIKQSIYRFRRANPGIFRRYEEQWRRHPEVGTRIPLADNFRSREALLEFVNAFFGAVMRPGIGGVACDADAFLRFGQAGARRPLSLAAKADDIPGDEIHPRVELRLLARVEEDEEPEDADDGDAGSARQGLVDLLATEKEARLVALRLRELRDQGHRVWDTTEGAFRPVRWKDMAVLMRAPANKVEAYAKEFHRAGVPLQASRGGFFATLEVMDLLNLLRLLDNPLQDVPLLAVLRSPLVGMSLEELVAIRGHCREPLFWTALHRFHREHSAGRPTSAPALLPEEAEPSTDTLRGTTPASPGEPRPVPEQAHDSEVEPGTDTPNAGRPLPGSATDPVVASAWSRADLFLRQFAAWRELVRHTSLSHCLETALTETHYDALLEADERGAERVANTRRLLDLCRQYDPYQRQGLHRFLRFVDAQQEAELDLEPAPLPVEDAVRLMSIHQSKGLEFPVVVLADIGKPFNLGGLYRGVLLDEHFGLCPSVVPPDTERRYPSLPLWLARQRERRETLGEELRLLYVAMTRARDTLILAGTLARKQDEGRWESANPTPLADQEILAARSYLDWLRLWLPQVTASGDWEHDSAGRNALLCWRIIRENDPQLAAPAMPSHAPGQSLAPLARLSRDAVAALRDRIEWTYPFASATGEPAKRSVTALVRSRVTPDEEALPWLPFQVHPSSFRERRVRSHSAGGPTVELSAAEAGSAHHAFLQLVSLDRVGSLPELREESLRLEKTGRLSAAQRTALDLDAVAAFWQSEIGRRIRAHADQVRRELPFTARFTPAELATLGLELKRPLGEDEFVVVQGVVDLVLMLPDHLTLVDFKTDDLRPGELAARVDHYRPQLQLYGRALEQIHARPVRERWLHFLSLGRAVAV